MIRALPRTALAGALVALVLFPTIEARRAPLAGSYVVTDLGTLGGLSAQAYDINQSGAIVGYATTAGSQGHAFLWRDGQMTDLLTLGGSQSDAMAVNDYGQVVGRSRINASSSTHAVLWDNGAKIDLTPGAEQAVANGINNHRQVVGTRNHSVAFLWQNGIATDLPHLGGGGGFASDINDAGQAVGSSYTTHVTDLGPMPHAVLWQNGTATDLGILPGAEDSGAAAINNLGQIVGSSGRTDPESYQVTSQSFIYANGMMTALPVPSTESGAADINDDGVVVGTMRAAGGASRHHAYIYADGVVTNLNSLIPAGSGLHLAYAFAINNDGQIAAVALDAQARYHAVLLTPSTAAPPPVPVNVTVTDVSKSEGNSGTTSFTFTVKLSAAAATPVSVSFATANGSARAAEDYVARAGVLAFAPGETSRTVPVTVVGDRRREGDEVFYLNLSSAAGAVVTDAQGAAIVRNDDR